VSDPVVILCGGRGTRLREHTETVPKPLIEVGGEPILWHVIKLYAEQGARRFLLCTGYKGEQVAHFARERSWRDGLSLECVDTGIDTPTGGRIAKVVDRVGGGRFHVTYADGVADIDLRELAVFHAAHGACATMTVVRPRLQFGVAQLDGDSRVIGFVEKPRAEHWINGGFFCFDAGALSYLEPDSVLERAPLERLAAEGQLRAHRHAGFWECMDTYKDAVQLNDLWAAGTAPWRAWD
jgi:glucose-1-phosphate cytidylyltransferase